MDDERFAVSIIHDSHGEAEADEEVGSCQVLQEDGHAGRMALSSEEINVEGEAVEDQTHLQTRRDRKIIQPRVSLSKDVCLTETHYKHGAVDHDEENVG